MTISVDENIGFASPVSVVIPLYNHARFIAEAIRSIQDQDHPVEEIVIIDDGSTDDSFEAALAAGAGDKRVRLIRQDNAGAATTINRAIALCHGAVVAILNSDDCFHKARLGTMVRRMVEEKEDFVFSRIVIIDNNSQILEPSWFDDAAEFWRISGRLDLSLIRGNFIGTTSNIVAKRRVFEQIGGFAPLPYCHDLDFFLRAIQKGIAIGFVDEPLLFYRKHDTNTIFTAPKGAVAIEHAAVAAQYVASQFLSNGVDVAAMQNVRRAVDVYARDDSTMATRFTVALAAALATLTSATTDSSSSSQELSMGWLPALRTVNRPAETIPSSLARYPYEVIKVWKSGVKVAEDAIFLHPGLVGTTSEIVFRVVFNGGQYLFNTRLTVCDPKSQPVCFEMVLIEAGIIIGEYSVTIGGDQSLVVNLPFTTQGKAADFILRTRMSEEAQNNYYAHASFVRPLIRPISEVAHKTTALRKVFVVLGMHRAGTSLCMQILNRLGIYVGGPLMAATESNPDGHWEHMDIHQQHEALLSLLGKTWSSPGVAQAIPPDWWDSPEVRKIRNTLRELVVYELEAGSGLWGFKDPRTVRFIPLWTGIFAELEVEPIWILAVRNPVSVAMSLHKRDNIPQEAGEILWIEHYLDAIRYLGPRISEIVRYENWFSAPLQQGYRLAHVTGCDDIDSLIKLDQILRVGIKPWLYRQRLATDRISNLTLTRTVDSWFDREPAALAHLTEIAEAIVQGETLGMKIVK